MGHKSTAPLTVTPGSSRHLWVGGVFHFHIKTLSFNLLIKVWR